MHFIDIPQRRPGAMRPRPPLEPGVSPDVLDPNHYCCVCDVKFAHANSYRIHIKKYHGLGDALEAITLKSRSKRSNYYLDRKYVYKCNIYLQNMLITSTGLQMQDIMKNKLNQHNKSLILSPLIMKPKTNI